MFMHISQQLHWIPYWSMHVVNCGELTYIINSDYFCLSEHDNWSRSDGRSNPSGCCNWRYDAADQGASSSRKAGIVLMSIHFISFARACLCYLALLLPMLDWLTWILAIVWIIENSSTERFYSIKSMRCLMFSNVVWNKHKFNVTKGTWPLKWTYMQQNT